MDTMTLTDYMRDATDSGLLEGSEELPMVAHLSEGRSRIGVVAGGNASGKSLYVQILAARARKNGVLPVSISIRERTGAGSGEMSSMRRTMMFGDESEQSTGATSIKTVQAGFRNLVRYAEEKPALLILDEPEMGLAEDYSQAMGQYLAREALALDQDNTLGVIVVSHSRPLVQALHSAVAQAGQTVNFISMDGPASVEDWLASPRTRSIEELLELPTLGLERWRSISRKLR